MKTHTPEPWSESLTPMISAGSEIVKLNGRPLSANARVLSEENFQRAIKCVNACAGMEDPVAEIAALRQRIAELEAQVPKKPQPNWHEAPEWAMWWAVDEDEDAWWYESEPRCSYSCWMLDEKFSDIDKDVNLNGFDWRETLTKRP